MLGVHSISNLPVNNPPPAPQMHPHPDPIEIVLETLILSVAPSMTRA